MRYSQIILFIALFHLSSCTEKRIVNAKGGKSYGGVFRFMSTEKVTNLLTLSICDTYTERLKSQLYDPLLKLDVSTMEVIPSIITSYTISDNGKKFRVKIRKGVFFHDNECFKDGKGPHITARDVKFSLDMACSGLKINGIGYLLTNRIVGAEQFYEQSKDRLPKAGVSGIKIIDDYTLDIYLKEPNVEFDKLLTFPGLSVISKAAFEYYKDELVTHPVGTGPFQLESLDEKGVKLKRNEHYWAKDEFGNQLPFIDEVQMTYTKSKKDELLAFRGKKTDVVFDIPVEEIENILGSLEDAQAGRNVLHRIESFTGTNIHYIGFAFESKVFGNINVRKALNYAIDRTLIIDEYLLGDGIAVDGVVPPIGEERDSTENVIGYGFNPKKAKELLTKAGYPNGKNFPTLILYVNAVDAWKAKKMSESVSDQLKEHLNINVKVFPCTFAQRKKAIADGSAKIWKSGWAADYPSPETFLRIFYTGNDKGLSSIINQFNFHNSSFDKLYENALCEKNAEKRAQLFAKCNQMVVDEAVVIPIMSNSQTIMINSMVKDLKQNSIEAMDFSYLYFNKRRT